MASPAIAGTNPAEPARPSEIKNESKFSKTQQHIVEKETNQSGVKDNERDKSIGNTLKKPSLKLVIIVACVSLASIPALWLEDFLWGFDDQFFCCMNWLVRGILLFAIRYIVLPVLLLILIFRLYISWHSFSRSARTDRLVLLIISVLPIFWKPEPLTPEDWVMLGIQAKVGVTGGAANLQKWAIATIEKAAQDVKDINELNGKVVERRLWFEQVRKLNPVNVSFGVSNTGIPYIGITLAVSWFPRGIIVGPPNFKYGDANTPNPYEFYPGVYGN